MKNGTRMNADERGLDNGVPFGNNGRVFTRQDYDRIDRNGVILSEDDAAYFGPNGPGIIYVDEPLGDNKRRWKAEKKLGGGR